MHSGQLLGEGAREGQVEDEHGTGGPRWVRGRGGGGGPGAEEPAQRREGQSDGGAGREERPPPPRTDEGAVGGGRDPGRDGPQGASGRRGGRDVGQTLK